MLFTTFLVQPQHVIFGPNLDDKIYEEALTRGKSAKLSIYVFQNRLNSIESQPKKVVVVLLFCCHAC